MLTLLLVSTLCAGPAGGTGVASSIPAPQGEQGAVLAPAALGPGSLAVYGLVGAPEVAVGYRQGFAALELEGRVAFDVLQAAGLVEGGVKVPVWRSGRFQLAAGGLLGLKLDSGARYADPLNFAAVALQPRPLAALSFEASELVSLLARAEVPLAIALTGPGLELRPALWLGGELRIGGGLSVLLLGQVGVDAIQPAAGVWATRLAWGVQLGLGYRVFE